MKKMELEHLTTLLIDKLKIITESEWLQKAKKLHKEALENLWGKNGSKKISAHQAHVLNDLQHAIGSHHGIHIITYSETRTTLDEMFEIVNRGINSNTKTGSLSKG